MDIPTKIDSAMIDLYPSAPKILFIAYSGSSHTLNWISLLEGSGMNVRLFAMPRWATLPPADWEFPVYVSAKKYDTSKLIPERHQTLYRPASNGMSDRIANKIRSQFRPQLTPSEWLAQIIREWRPDVIDTLGADSAYFYDEVRREYELGGIGRWIFTIRGGADIELQKLDPDEAPKLAKLLQSADFVVSDNVQSVESARELGVREEQIPTPHIFPSAGGVDVMALAQKWTGCPPSQRRILLWPKAINAYYSPVQPIFEALKLCWDQIQPCELYILSMSKEARSWYWTLPDSILRASHPLEHLSHVEALDLMSKTRVVLAPSMLDGMPNVLLEAMACGAFPIVSPLGSLTPIVKQEDNVLFARSVYINEIVEALVRSMNDDQLVDHAAQRNLELVRQIADRPKVREQALAFYRQVAQRPA